MSLLAASSAAAQTSKLIFDDEFNGSAVSAPWSISTGGGYAASQCWVNDLQHVSEGGGYLSLTATYEPSGGACGTYYESGSIWVPASTWSYLYGTAQARIKVPCQSGTGLWPSFWQYASQDPSTDANGEIDSGEIMTDPWNGGPSGSGGQYVLQAIHGTGLPLDRQYNSWSVYNSNWCGAFHVFGNTWTPNSVTFTVDGVTEHTFNRRQFSAWPLTTPQAPVLSLLVGQFGGTPNPATFPQTMLVDWIRIRHNG